MQVRDIMTRDLVTVASDASLTEVQALFEAHGFHHLLVTELGRLQGVISDRDLLRALSPFVGTMAERARDAATLDQRAHQIMSYKALSVPENTAISEVARCILDAGVSCMVVTDVRGRIKGIVTWRDLLKHLVHQGPQGLASPT